MLRKPRCTYCAEPATTTRNWHEWKRQYGKVFEIERSAPTCKAHKQAPAEDDIATKSRVQPMLDLGLALKKQGKG